MGRGRPESFHGLAILARVKVCISTANAGTVTVTRKATRPLTLPKIYHVLNLVFHRAIAGFTTQHAPSVRTPPSHFVIPKLPEHFQSHNPRDNRTATRCRNCSRPTSLLLLRPS